MNEEPPDSIKRFLKKPIPSVDIPKIDPKEFIQKKLIEEPQEYYSKKRNWKEKFKIRTLLFTKQFFFFKTRQFKRFMNETFPMVAFITFSCYIIYKMEDNFNKMKDKVVINKSLKQLEVDKENEEIRKILFDDNSQPQKTDILSSKRKQKYKFEYFDDDDNTSVISTKDEMLKEMYKEDKLGTNIPIQYKKDFENYKKTVNN